MESYGGVPVWHISVMPLPFQRVPDRELKRIAYRHLAGVGDRSCEWEEVSQRCFHLRRRVTPAESEQVGLVRDVRKTPEGRERMQALWNDLIGPGRKLALEELEIIPEEILNA